MPDGHNGGDAVQCKYCDFEGTEGEVMDHLMQLAEVSIGEHKRLSSDELHERYVEPASDHSGGDGDE
jgi:hypothetical protein